MGILSWLGNSATVAPVSKLTGGGTARGSKAATTAETSAQNLSNQYAGDAANLFGTLAPTLMGEIAHPPGMGPTDMAAADTAAQQSGGGSMAGAVGQGGLLAARTRNAGAPAAAIGEVARTSGETLSKAALTTRLKDAAMREEQRQGGIRGLGDLYGETMGGGLKALGIVPAAVSAESDAARASWEWAHAMGDLLRGIGANKPSIMPGGGG